MSTYVPGSTTEKGMTRNDVIDLVMLVFDSVATSLIPSPA